MTITAAAVCLCTVIVVSNSFRYRAQFQNSSQISSGLKAKQLGENAKRPIEQLEDMAPVRDLSRSPKLIHADVYPFAVNAGLVQHDCL